MALNGRAGPRIASRLRLRGMTFSTATFLHFCMAADTGSRRSVSGNTHVRLFEHRPAAAYTKPTTCVVTAVHPVESNRQRPAVPGSVLISIIQRLSSFTNIAVRFGHWARREC